MKRQKNQEFVNRIKGIVKAYKTPPTGREVEGTVELLEEIAQYLSDEGEALTIETPIEAEIVAEVTPDPQYPGIYLYYKKKGEKSCDRDTALLEWDDTNKQLRLAVWRNENSEDYTHNFPLLQQSQIPGLTNERYTQMMRCYGNLETVKKIVKTWGTERCNKGYDIFDYFNTGMFQIDGIEDVKAFETEEDAVEQAIRDGVKVIPIEELPEGFDRRYLGWIDTPDNRDAIAEYTDKYCSKRKGSRTSEEKHEASSGDNEDWIPVEQQLPEEGKPVRIKYKNIYGQWCEDVDERLSGGWGSGWDDDIVAWKPIMENEGSLFSALAISEPYVWQGVGRTEGEARESLIKEWNRFFEANETLDTFEYDIIVHRCIPGTGSFTYTL